MKIIELLDTIIELYEDMPPQYKLSICHWEKRSEEPFATKEPIPRISITLRDIHNMYDELSEIIKQEENI